MVTTEQLLDKLTLELGVMLVNNISLGLQVDALLLQVTTVANRNIELQARVEKDMNIISGLKGDLDRAGVRAKLVSLPVSKKVTSKK